MITPVSAHPIQANSDPLGIDPPGWWFAWWRMTRDAQSESDHAASVRAESKFLAG